MERVCRIGGIQLAEERGPERYDGNDERNRKVKVRLTPDRCRCLCHGRSSYATQALVSVQKCRIRWPLACFTTRIVSSPRDGAASVPLRFSALGFGRRHVGAAHPMAN